MPIRNEPELVGFDTDAALDAAMAALDGLLYSFVEFTFEDFNVVYVADETLAMYEDEAQMEAHFEQLHDYVNLDFMEIQLFTDALLPAAEEVRYITTSMDYITLVRLYRNDEGLFFAIDTDESVVALVEAVRGTYGAGDDGATG